MCVRWSEMSTHVHVDVFLMHRFGLGTTERYEELYCFSYNSNADEQERWREWALLDVTADYNRMGLPNALWKLSPVNQQYKVGAAATRERWRCGHTVLQWRRREYLYWQVSDTYPADLFVPKCATPPVIVGSSKFRSRGRFPALSYYSKENQVCWWRFSSFSQRYLCQTFCLFCLSCFFWSVRVLVMPTRFLFWI